MIALLEFIVAVFLLPWLIVGVLIKAVWDAFSALVSNPLFVASILPIVVGFLTFSHMEPDPSIPWNTPFDIVAQATILGVPVPYLAFALGFGLLALSIPFAVSRHKDRVVYADALNVYQSERRGAGNDPARLLTEHARRSRPRR